MSVRHQSATATVIRQMAERHHVTYVRTENDELAHHITRLAGDHVELDEIEQILIALQRAGHVSRAELVRLQAKYLRETRPRPSIRLAILKRAVISAISPTKRTSTSSGGLSIRRSLPASTLPSGNSPEEITFHMRTFSTRIRSCSKRSTLGRVRIAHRPLLISRS